VAVQKSIDPISKRNREKERGMLARRQPVKHPGATDRINQKGRLTQNNGQQEKKILT
jgi:hypothetical protein